MTEGFGAQPLDTGMHTAVANVVSITKRSDNLLRLVSLARLKIRAAQHIKPQHFSAGLDEMCLKACVFTKATLGYLIRQAWDDLVQA